MKLFNTPVNGIYLPIIMSSIWPTASSNFVSMAFELWKKKYIYYNGKSIYLG